MVLIPGRDVRGSIGIGTLIVGKFATGRYGKILEQQFHARTGAENFSDTQRPV